MKQYFSGLLVDLEHWGDNLSNDIWYMVETVVRSHMTPEIMLLHDPLLQSDPIR